MKINIDLNKLTFEELKQLIEFVNKQKENNQLSNTVIEHPIQKPTYYRRRKREQKINRETDTRIERMRFISKKVRELMALDNTLTYNMAFGRAAFMWKNRGVHHVPIIYKLDIWPLSEIGNTMLESSLKNLDNGSLTKIDFNYAVTNLAIRHDLQREWDINLWREFLNQLVRNSKRITAVLGKEAGSIFKIVRYEGNDVIVKR